MFRFTTLLMQVAAATRLTSVRRGALRLVPLLLVLAALTESARAGDTVVYSDGGFGAGLISSKILDNCTCGSFVSTTQPDVFPNVYRDTVLTLTGPGDIIVAHIDPQFTHVPFSQPISTIDFAADLHSFTISQSVKYRLALRQNGTTYGGPAIDALNGWASYVQYALNSASFVKYAGSGPAQPDFSCNGGDIEFGFLTSTDGGPITKVSGLDNWLVTVHLAVATYSDDTLYNGLWPNWKVRDTTPGSLATWANTSFSAGGNPTDFLQTTHTYTNGELIVAHTRAGMYHNPAVEPVYTVDFSADAQHQTASSVGGAVSLRPLILQGGRYYMGPAINVSAGTWNTYTNKGLTANDFVLVLGGGPLHPNFTNSGFVFEFGYLTGTATTGGPITKAIGIDNWVVRMNLAPPCSFPPPGPLGIASCFGDDIANPCPCYPSVPLGGVGRGCANSIEPSGALLIGLGTASISNDTVILQGTGMPNSFCMYFQGTSPMSVPFGNGKLCTGGTIVRMAVKLNINASSQYPAGAQPSISVDGGIVTPGTRLYQVWYRDSPISCSSATYNLTNTLAINWTL